jgi:hypothetical protein
MAGEKAPSAPKKGPAEEKPAKPPEAGKAQEPATGDELARQLGIDQIQDPEKRKLVEHYFKRTLSQEQLSSLIHGKAQKEVLKLRQQIQFLNQRHASAEEFVKEIIKTMQNDVLERDMHEGYVDANGPQPSYVEQFINQVGTKRVQCPGYGIKSKGYDKSLHDIDWDDQQTFDYCLNFVKGKIRSVPPDVKREIRHKYADALIKAYAQAIDNYDWWMEKFDYDEREDPEKQLEKKFPYILKFDLWLAREGLKMEDVTYQYSQLDTKAIVATKSGLEQSRKQILQFPKPRQDYYTQVISEIEGFAITNPTQAQEQIAAVEKDIAALTAFLAFGEEIKGSRSKLDELKGKNPSLDSKFLDRINGLQKNYDERSKLLDAEINPPKRLVVLDFTDLKKTKDQFDLDLQKVESDLIQQQAASQEKPQEGQAAAAEEAEEKKPGFLDKAVLGDSKLGKMVVDFASKIPLIGGFLLGVFLPPSTLKKLGITAPTSLGDYFKSKNKPMTPEQLKQTEEKAKKLLEEVFKIEKMEELKLLATITVKDFLKERPKDIDQKKYDKLVKSLKDNGATEYTDKKVMEYVIEHVDDWKR